jgi:hypothetical protein
MYISRVVLRNIRGFSGSRDVDLPLTRPDGSHAGWTVIAGRNASGKTSLLRAIALAVAGPLVTRNLMPDSQDWITVGQNDAFAELHLKPDASIDYWPDAGKQQQASRFAINLHWVAPSGQESSRRRGIQPSLLSSAPESFAEGPWQANPAGWFCAAYGPFRRLAGGVSDVQRLMATPGPVARMGSLFYEDASLTEGVQWLIEQHLRELERKFGAEDLKNAAISILSDGLLPDDYQLSDVDSDGLWVITDDHRFSIREMSDGYRTVVALVVDLLKQLNDCYGGLSFETRDGIPTISSPGVVLIDEADAHLHVSWQKRIGGWLKTHFPNIQFIVTSHSPYICQAADEGGLIRLAGPHDEEPPRVVEQDLYERIVFGSGDDAVLSELFGLDSPYSEHAEELRRELVTLEVKVVSGQASKAEIASYQALRRRLGSSPVARVDEVAARIRESHE